MTRYRYRTSKDFNRPSAHFYQHGDALLMLLVLAIAFPLFPLLFVWRVVRVLPMATHLNSPYLYGNLLFHLLILLWSILILVCYFHRYRNVLFLVYVYFFFMLISPIFTINSGLFEFVLIAAIAVATLMLYYRSYQLKNLFPHHFIFHFIAQSSSDSNHTKWLNLIFNISIFLYIAILFVISLYLLFQI